MTHQPTMTHYMRKMLLYLVSSIALASASGQNPVSASGQNPVSASRPKTERALSLNSGLFSFSGRSATSSSFINYGSDQFPGYTNNPYGSRPGWSYGLSADVKHLVLGHFLIGLNAGYEVLRSEVQLTSVDGFIGNTVYNIPASGQTVLSSKFINLFPYLGYRFKPGAFSVDITGGFDLAHCLSAAEKGTAESDTHVAYHASLDRKTITTDFRPRCQLTFGYHKVGVYLGYSKGVSNYMAGYVGGPTGAYAHVIRFGLQYRLI